MSLTPYDTGERAEPHLWVRPGNAAPLDPAVDPHAEELRDNYGKVEFDNDESATVAIVHIERTEDGNYRLVVDDWSGDLDVRIIRE